MIATASAIAIAAIALRAQDSDFARIQRRPPTGEIHVLPVQGNVYMFSGDGGNTTVQVERDGVLLVDTQFGDVADKIMAEVRKLNRGPVRFIINTSMDPDHVGGNAELAKMIPQDPTRPLAIIAHENVLNRLTTPVTGSVTPPIQLGLPTDEYFTKSKDLHFNGEAIIIYHEPNAHTDGDSVVLFRGSDVVSAGDIFTPDSYPSIDLEHGGSIDGEIAALNHILELTVPAHTQEGGTYVIPGHGHLCDEADVVEYRDMIVIVRDRIQDLIKKGRNLAQVDEAQPTLDYDGRFTRDDGLPDTSNITRDAFILAVYKGLGGK
jgi:glyoxylase-like metal-dependent hydrolase (beta-lactamase superfamily II)